MLRYISQCLLYCTEAKGGVAAARNRFHRQAATKADYPRMDNEKHRKQYWSRNDATDSFSDGLWPRSRSRPDRLGTSTRLDGSFN
jgi:hypothetical protein